jgi:predicted nuclease of predicted toxin-antitoxin system
MRLLLDECIPRPLLRDLSTHDAHHVVDMGWSSKRNGELLKLMLADRFEILLTVDQNLPFQQNLRASGIGVVVVLALTNRVKELRPLIPQILEALGAVKPGALIKVGG